MVEKTDVFIIDSSAVFSGKPLNFHKGRIVTTSKIKDEFSPGGKDYRLFQLLIEKGMQILDPNKSSIKIIEKKSKEKGEIKRLSDADISVLSLAFQMKNEDIKSNPTIISDDYSIQNIANFLNIKVQPINQKGITKRFKWERRCQGCKIKITNDEDVCPICGSLIKHIVKQSSAVKKKN